MKLVFKILGILIVLILVGVILLITLVSPNQFKPFIEDAAKKQGIALQMGDLGWAFWPSLGVNLADIKVAALVTPNEPVAELNSAGLMLALVPLFGGELKVNHIQVDGARIHLALDKQGKGNWESLVQKTESSAAQAPTSASPVTDSSEGSSPLNLAVERISVHNSALDYSDAQTGQTINLRDLNLDLTEVNTQGNPFGVSVKWLLEMAQAGSSDKLQLEGSLQNKITLDKDLNGLQLDDGTLHVKLTAKSSADLSLNYSIRVQELKSNPTYQGQLELQTINARQWLAATGTTLETANSNALTQVALNTQIKGDTKQTALESLTVTLDKTLFSGNIAVTDFSTSALKVAMQGDSINVDDYLPPPSETPEKVTTKGTAEDTPLPMEALRGLNLDAKFNLAKMIVNNMTLEAIDLRVKAKNGIIDQKLTAKAYQGDIKFSSNTDARADKATMTFDGGVQGFELAPLLKDMKMDENLGLSGAIQAQTQGMAQGASVNQLMESMNSTASFSGAQVRLSPLNIEQQFCKMVNLLTQNNADDVTWDAFTEMRQLNGNVVWKDQVIDLGSFNAGVSQLLLTSTGKINLAKDKYEFKLPLKLAEASEIANLKGCSLSSSNFWVDRGLSLLRCKGSLGAINPLSDCGFDKGALADLTKDFAEYKLREKHGAKIDAAEEKLKNKKQDLLDKANEKLGGEGTVKKPKDLFNNLLKKQLGEKQASSVAKDQNFSADSQ